MATFKHRVSNALSLHGWNIFRWLQGQKKVAITGMTIFLMWALVNNSVISSESAIALAGMSVAALYAIIEFYLKEVNLEE